MSKIEKVKILESTYDTASKHIIWKVQILSSNKIIQMKYNSSDVSNIIGGIQNLEEKDMIYFASIMKDKIINIDFEYNKDLELSEMDPKEIDNVFDEIKNYLDKL